MLTRGFLPKGRPGTQVNCIVSPLQFASRQHRHLQVYVDDDHPLDPDLLEDGESSVCSGADGSGASTVIPTETALTPITTTNSSQLSSRRKFPSDLKTIKCPSCPKTFNRPARLAAHLRSHTNDRPFKCPFAGCAKDYLEEKHLKQHVKGSHTQDRRYVCDEQGCGRAFVTATRLRRHAAVHEGAERFRCRGFPGCDLSFRKHQTLQRHVRTEHLRLPAFPCASHGCAAGFDTAGALRRHVEREHGEARFWCDECSRSRDRDGNVDGDGGIAAAERGESKGVGFTTMAQLQTHMRREHVDCMFCDVRCGTQGQLERHIEMYHSGTTAEQRKTIPCSWEGCPKTFTRRNNLNMHVRTAHEGFRFVCGRVDTFGTEDIADWNWTEEGCGEGFISKMKLEEHIRFMHLGRRRPPRVHTVGLGADDLLGSLAGVADDARRNIPCSTEGCYARFFRYHDLRGHLQKAHGVGPAPHQDLVEPNDDRLDGPNYNMSGGPEIEGGLEDPPENPAGEEEFWFAADGTDEQGRREFEREWADMRRLIDVDALTDGRGA